MKKCVLIKQKLCQFTKKTEFLIGLLIFIPQFMLIAISLFLISLNLMRSRDGLQQFSQTLYDQQMYLVEIQNTAALKALIQQMQHESWTVNMLYNLNSRVINGKILTNENYIKPVLNIEETYKNQGDPYLLNLYKYNSSLLISSWHQKDTLNENELSVFGKDQMRNASYIDFMWKSALLANKKRIKENGKHKIIIKSYFMAFNSDGMFYGSGTNTTFQNVHENPLCPKGKYKQDSRCQEYFLIASKLTRQIGFPPTLFLYDAENQPYNSCGLCKKINMPEGFRQKYKKQFEIYPQLNAFSIICDSVYLQKIELVFENIGQKKSIRILLDPYTLRLAYQSDYTLKKDEVITIKESYLNRLDNDKDRQLFLDTINSFYKKSMIKFCSRNKDEVFRLTYNHTKQDFTFFMKGVEMVAIQEFTYIIDRLSTIEADGKRVDEYCYLTNLQLITIMSKEQLMAQAIILSDLINIIEIVFKVSMYCTIGLSLIVSLFNTKKISNMLNNSVEHLTSILNKLKVDEETKNFILFEDGMLTGNFQIDCSELFLSSDMLFLYESFQNLFQTLIFTTQNIFDQDECLTLILLNKQISYFQQFRNYRALGICYNNIGNIHLNNNRFMEALENYSQAIVYCNYELNHYEESTIDLQKLKENDQNKIKLVESEIAYRQERNSSDLMKISGPKKKLKQSIMKISFLQTLKKSFLSKSNQQSKQNIKQQDSLLKALQLYGLESSQKFQQTQSEIYWMLFNRKFNYVKALYHLMTTYQKVLADWDLVEAFIIELKDISNFRLPPSNKRDILINQMLINVLQNKSDIYESVKILEENETLFEQTRCDQKKPPSSNFQNISSNNYKSSFLKSNLFNSNNQFFQILASQNAQQQTQDSKNNKEQVNYTFDNQNNIPQIDNINQTVSPLPYQFNMLSSFNNYSQSPINTHTAQQNIFNKLISNQQHSINQKQNISIPLNLVGSQQSPIKIRQIQKKHVGFSPKEQQNTQFQQAQGSPLAQKRPGFQYLRSIISKKSSNLDETHLNNTNIIESPSNHNNFSSNFSPGEDSFCVLNPNHSPLQPNTYQNQNTILDSQKDESPMKKKQVSIGKSSTATMQNSPQPSFQMNKNVQDWVNGKQKKNMKSKLQSNLLSVKINEDDDTCRSKKSRKSFAVTNYNFSSFNNSNNNNINMRDTIISNNQYTFGEHSSRSKRSKHGTNEKFKSNSKLYLDHNHDEINQFELKDEIIHGIILEQISTVDIMKKNFLNAAETLTKYFEDTKTIIPYLHYKCFKKLMAVLEKFNLTHPQLDYIYKQLNSDISFKIIVVHFDWEESLGKDPNHKVGFNMEQSFFSCQTQGVFQNANEDQIENRAKKKKIMNLFETIIDEVMRNHDDYLGFIASSFRDMFIEEKITMISRAQMSKNMEIFKKELYKYFVPPPVPFYRNRNLNQTIDQDDIQTPSPVRKVSRSLQLDKKKVSPIKRLSNRDSKFLQNKQNSPSSASSFNSCHVLAEKRKKSPTIIKIHQSKKQIQALQNMLLQNHRQNENFRLKSLSGNVVSDPQININNKQNKSIFKLQNNTQNQFIPQNNQITNNSQIHQFNNQNNTSNINNNNNSRRTTIQIEQKTTNNFFTSQSQLNDQTHINSNNNSFNNSQMMNLSNSNVLKSDIKFLQNNNQQLDKTIEPTDNPIILQQINGFLAPPGMTNSLVVSQSQINQKELINNVLEDRVDESVKFFEKEQMCQLSPILEEISRRNINTEELKKLQKLSLCQSSSNQDTTKLTLKNTNQDTLNTFTNWVNIYSNTNLIPKQQQQQQQQNSSTSILETPPKIQQKMISVNSNLPQSEKKQFLPIKQISLNEDENKIKSLADIHNQAIKKRKRELFYYSIRKALQEVASQYDGKSISLQLNTLHNKFLRDQQITKNINSDNHIQKQDNQCSKNHFIKNNQHKMKISKKYFKKFIVAVTDDLNMIDQNEKEFKILANNLKNLQVELCILCQNEGISIKEGTEYNSIVIEDTYVVSYFHCEQNLLLYLITSRCTKYHDCIPLIVEHF